MKRRRPSKAIKTEPALHSLLATCHRLRFEPHHIGDLLDDTGRYEEPLDREFPFLIRLFHYASRHVTRSQTWHDRLELFIPLDGPVRFVTAGKMQELQAGDLLVVDNLKPHWVVDFPGFNTRVIVISFFQEFVYSLGSPSHDYAFLLPFYSKFEQRPHVLQARDAGAQIAYDSLAKLVACYFGKEERALFRTGCKAYLLELLYHLATRFRSSEILKWEFTRQQQRSERLKKLFDHISRQYAEKLSVAAAAKLAGMSSPQFMKTFKRVAGMTLVAYLNHVRLANGARLLRETDHSIAEIASETGFADQSYFDKRFKLAFGKSPKEFRREAVQPEAVTPR